MTTLVNGRVVKNSMLYRTISDSYSNFKEDGKYPICVIYIEIFTYFYAQKTQSQRGMKFGYMLQHDWTLKTLHLMK